MWKTPSLNFPSFSSPNRLYLKEDSTTTSYMVTPDAELGVDADALARALDKSSKKWDLVNMDLKDTWLLNLDGVFASDQEAWAALEYGPPTLEIVKLSDDSMTDSVAERKLLQLQDKFAKGNKRGFTLLCTTIAFHRRPALASRAPFTSAIARARQIDASQRGCVPLHAHERDATRYRHSSQK